MDIASANAQVFRRFSGKDGAPVTTINDISQYRYGMMWFATTSGLISFDSRVFKKYAHDPKKPNTVHSDYIE
ncbi:hypothetical protein [Dyadobacter sp. 32]|uniref:hypothetical protein n=1 Tax=Dyadobacter sp. 32 TaxID=538966 RepID=UPI0011EBCB9F